MESPLCIVGGGIAGLVAARALSRKGLSSIIYDRSAPTPRHSYGITLQATSYRPLLDILELSEPLFRARVSVDAGQSTGQAKSPEDIRANRRKFESLLRENLDIRWNHQLDRASITSSGGIDLRFTNGVNVTTDAVIAADGVHSPIRSCLLPDLKPCVLPVVAFNGKRRLPLDTFDVLYRSFRIHNSIELYRPDGGGARLCVQLNEYTQDHVSISWIYSRKAKPIDPLFRPDRPNSAAENIPDQFFTEIEDLVPIEQPFRDVFDVELLRKERILSWLMRTVEVDGQMLRDAPDKVFLVGDAIHAEAILGGNGANNAIEDGISLAEYIAKYKGVSSARQWYQTRQGSWQKSLKQSKAAITEMHSKQGPAL